MRTETIAIALLASAAAVAAGAAQDWNQWRGPARTGVTSAFAAPATWPDRPARTWQATLGVGHSSPVVSDGRVFQHSRIGEQDVVTAVDLRTGKQLWQQRYDEPFQVNYAAEAHGKGPKSTPAVVNGRLYTFGINGTLSAFDTSSGRVVWRKRFEKEFDDTAPDFGTAMSPVVEGDLLIAHVGGMKTGALAALATATGDVRWTWKGDGPAYASPVLGTFGKTRQLITQTRSHLVGVSVSDGTLLWRIPFTTSFNQNIVTPVISGDLVIYSGHDKPLTAARIVVEGGRWVAREVWRNETVPLYMSSPVISGEHLFGLTHRNKGQFFAVDVRSGRTLWTSRGREAESAALVLAGELILAATTEGELVVARPDPQKFDVIRRYTVAESPVWAHPVPADGGILIKDAETLTYWTFGAAP